jgi:hypothetical protein
LKGGGGRRGAGTPQESQIIPPNQKPKSSQTRLAQSHLQHTTNPTAPGAMSEYMPRYKNKSTPQSSLQSMTPPIPYSPSDKKGFSATKNTKSTPLRQRSQFHQQRLNSAVDVASYYINENRKLRQSSQRLKKENQSLTHHIAFGNDKRPETPRSESRKLRKSPMRRKRTTRVRKRLNTSNTEREQLLFMVKGVVVAVLLYLLWGVFRE